MTVGFVVETKVMEPRLLVEDKTELRTMLRKALERAGYAVDEAPDGAAAIQKVRARRYLMVITDLKMPGASGLDVLRETKQADAAIPVLLLTAYGSVEEAVGAMKEGAFDFLRKPVDLEHFKRLAENDLFGHERGAFTGAGARKVGKMDLAHRGTLFLDEIGELPLGIQAKLLRVLEERRFERVGGTQSIDVDVRIVVATNRDL